MRGRRPSPRADLLAQIAVPVATMCVEEIRRVSLGLDRIEFHNQKGPPQPCGLASPRESPPIEVVRGLEVGGLEDGILSLREGGGVELWRVEGWWGGWAL